MFASQNTSRENETLDDFAFASRCEIGDKRRRIYASSSWRGWSINARVKRSPTEFNRFSNLVCLSA